MRLSFRADRADLVLDGMLCGIDAACFIDVHPQGWEWGSLTCLLRRRGWTGGYLLQPGPAGAGFSGLTAPHLSETGTVNCQDFAATDASRRSLTIAHQARAWFGDGQVCLVCIGAGSATVSAVLGMLPMAELPWVLCIEHPTGAAEGSCLPCLLEPVGYSRLFAGPTFDTWVSARAPASIRGFSYAAAVVMQGPALPAALLPAEQPVQALLTLDMDAFIEASYWSVLRRPPDNGGREHYRSVLQRGGSRVGVLLELALSEEAGARQVGQRYRNLADPADGTRVAGPRNWASQLWRAVAARARRAAASTLGRLSGDEPFSAKTNRSAGSEQPMDWPHYKISYAQNFEDLVLAGLLKSVSAGFYVDVGANHPELDSVTKIFYDKGWRGINVEPNAELHRLLSEQRPLDVNVMAAASSQPGSLMLRVYEGLDGLSTISRETKAAHESGLAGRRFRDLEVPVVCLADLLLQHRASGDIHFMKIDVEGLEMEVLLGNDWQRFRPWVLCLERNLHVPRQQAICTYLSELGYQAVFWDGINDFFVANEHLAIWASFSYANDVVMDGVPVNYIFVRTMAALASRAAPRD